MAATFLNRFLLSHGAGAFATGIHLVLLSWLGVGVLHLSPSQIGWVQAVALLPNLCLMLLAGVWADRSDPAKIIAGAYGLHAVSYGVLAYLLYSGQLSFISLLLYGAAVGTGNAFIQPVREKLLSSIETHHVQKRLSYASIIQFSFQSFGILLASSSEHFGYHWVASVQVGFALVALVAMLQLQNLYKASESANSLFQDAILGFKMVSESPSLRQLMLLIGFNGYMHLGVYLVVLPVMAKSVYGFTAAQYGILQLIFVLGMIAAHLNLIYKKTLQFPGQGALFSLLYTAVVGFALAKGPTIYGFYFLVFAWGFVAGNSAGRCRLVVQAASSAEMKGRVMSIYQFVLFGAAPIGALVTGYVIKYLQISDIFYVMSVSSAGIFVIFMLTKALWNVEQDVESSDL